MITAVNLKDGSYHEDVGYGNGKGTSRPQGLFIRLMIPLFLFHYLPTICSSFLSLSLFIQKYINPLLVIEKAKKQACTDALKRALKFVALIHLVFRHSP